MVQVELIEDLETQKRFLPETHLEFDNMPALGSGTNEDDYKYGRTGKGRI